MHTNYSQHRVRCCFFFFSILCLSLDSSRCIFSAPKFMCTVSFDQNLSPVELSGWVSVLLSLAVVWLRLKLIALCAVSTQIHTNSFMKFIELDLLDLNINLEWLWSCTMNFPALRKKFFTENCSLRLPISLFACNNTKLTKKPQIRPMKNNPVASRVLLTIN